MTNLNMWTALAAAIVASRRAWTAYAAIGSMRPRRLPS